MIIAQGYNNQTDFQVLLYILIPIGVFFGGLYIFRSIFNIPSFLRYQKAQIRLLEQIAKKQGVEDSKLESIISEAHGWDSAPTSAAATNKAAEE
jgi:hypothetical protein